jgi:DNA polymerase-3 subunit epsilon
MKIINEDEKVDINPSRFVAFDFETANKDLASVCALGIVKVENLEIVEKRYWLIRPFELYFDPFNVSIHGITEEDVKDKPEFDRLWPEIKSYLENNLVLAHYASFDLSVLRHVLDKYDIKYPEFPYSCTWYISKRLWKGLSSYCLDSISNHLNIDFIHHNAEEDARACSLIAIKACEKNRVKSFEELARSIHLNHGYIRPNEYNPVGGFSSKRVKDYKPQTDTFDESCQVFNKSFVFTGTLESMTRKEAIQRTVDCGGICHQMVREDSNYLVLGIQDYRKLKDGKRSNKMKKAESLILRGSDLEIINEDDFLRMFS